MAPNAAFAVEPYEDADEDICTTAAINDPLLCGNKNANEENTLMNTVGNVLNAIYGVIAVVAVVMIVIAGIKYSTSQGDPGKVQSAKNTIMYSIIGLVITTLPDTGYYSGESGENVNYLRNLKRHDTGYYWTSTIYGAKAYVFINDAQQTQWQWPQTEGCAIRPVRE